MLCIVHFSYVRHLSRRPKSAPSRSCQLGCGLIYPVNWMVRRKHRNFIARAVVKRYAELLVRLARRHWPLFAEFSRIGRNCWSYFDFLRTSRFSNFSTVCSHSSGFLSTLPFLY